MKSQQGQELPVDVYLPNIDEINQELASLINQRVIHHLSQILRQLSSDHQINFEKLKEQYLDPLVSVVDELNQ